MSYTGVSNCCRTSLISLRTGITVLSTVIEGFRTSLKHCFAHLSAHLVAKSKSSGIVRRKMVTMS